MDELAERARLLVSGLVKGILDAENTVEYCDLDSELGLSFAMPLIEQALLAERRLAMEEALEIALDYVTGICQSSPGDSWDPQNDFSDGQADGAKEVAKALRAAAEKEVGTK